MSNKETKQTASGGIGFAGLLTILFIGLKLTGVITWSWGWVLAPLWIPVILVIGIILLIVIVPLIFNYFEDRKYAKRSKNK